MDYLHGLFQSAIDQGASDIHLKPDAPVTFRVAGRLTTPPLERPTQAQVAAIVHTILPPHLITRLETDHEVDFSYLHDQRWRFRVNVFHFF